MYTLYTNIEHLTVIFAETFRTPLRVLTSEAKSLLGNKLYEKKWFIEMNDP